MSPAATEALPLHPVISHENLLFDYPEADVIFRSRDSYEFRVLKIYIAHSSPILGDKVLISPTPQPKPTSSTIPAESDVDPGPSANAHPVVQLPIDGAILFSLLTYIFPVPPVLPSTVEQVMELLSVAQMYKMDVVLTHIRNHIAQQEPPFIREETAFLIYSLSQKHALRAEALQAARCTLSFSSLTIQDLAEEHQLDLMPGSFLHELWKYHQRVRSNLTSDLNEFKKSSALPGDSGCESLADSGLPDWLDSYISGFETARVPAFLDLADFYTKLVEHIEHQRSNGGCTSCLGMLGKKIRVIWEALTAIVHGSIVKAETCLSLPVEETRSEGQASRPSPTRKTTSLPDADIVLQSSDLVDFHVHRSVLVASSPFFRDMFSLPQPKNDAMPESHPVVHLSEDAETLNSLISMLYPVAPKIPLRGDDILTLLAAATKYDMDAIQSFIRAEVSHKKLLSSPFAGGAFHVYAVAYSKRLAPEIAATARDTLGYPLTFEGLGYSLRSFESGALHDLADFRLRTIGNFSSNLKLFSGCIKGPSKIWVGCPAAKGENTSSTHSLPPWLEFLSSGHTLAQRFTETIPTSAQLRDKYMKALQSHVKKKDCNFCMRVHILEGEKYCEKLGDIATKARTQAWNVPAPDGETWNEW
ncbi:hypothetical protein F5888DRAFT_1800213 [Russula emetica]|nr:hypothetical protein F5888DRAFT_1800213 [Russula emetica]